jgi:hypothetical protein
MSFANVADASIALACQTMDLKIKLDTGVTEC